MAYSKAQAKATMKWKKENVKRVEINLNKETDADVIEYFESTGNTQGEIKRLARARIKGDIFTNHEMNLIRTCINVRINELDDYVEEAEEVIKEAEAMREKTPLDMVKQRETQRIGKNKADIKMWSKEADELRDLRRYIDDKFRK